MDAALSDPLVDRLLDGRYSVASRVARGGMSSVYLATDTRLDRRVAVKVMNPALADDPEFVARFHREARAAAQLSHPDIVAVYDQGHDDGAVFLVMEYVAGATLRDILRERARLSVDEALAVMDHVLAALGAAHAAGLVHRDVKPENVLVTTDGRVKVADFGLARAIAGATLTSHDGVLLGTAAYLAPEQVRENVADARSDVYAAGVLLFELLTGAPPFAGDSSLAIAYRHVSDDVPPPSERASRIPSIVDDLVTLATARDPTRRPANGAAFHEALTDVREQLGAHGMVPTPPPETVVLPADAATAPTASVQRTSALPPAAPPPETGRRRRRRWPFVLAAVVVAAALAGVGGWWFAVGRYTPLTKVIGWTQQDAVARLHKDGFKVRWLGPAYSDTIRQGLVALEKPRPGTHVRSGATVALALSKGVWMVKVPNVHGDHLANAKATLEKAHLNVAGETRDYSDSVKKGLVISTSPRAGASVRHDSDVTVVVSKGPSPVDVPDVAGKSENDAEQLLKSVGLGYTVVKQFDDTVPDGRIISTDPAAGATAHTGDTVTLYVSKGPQLFKVPDVEGKQIDQAIRIIEHAGFRANPRQIFPGGPGNVVREKPKGMQPKGTAIELDYF